MMCDVPVSNSNQFFYVRPRDDTLNNLIIKLNEEISQIGYNNHCGFLLRVKGAEQGQAEKLALGMGDDQLPAAALIDFSPVYNHGSQ